MKNFNLKEEIYKFILKNSDYHPVIKPEGCYFKARELDKEFLPMQISQKVLVETCLDLEKDGKINIHWGFGDYYLIPTK